MQRSSILKAVLLTATMLTVLTTVQAQELITYQGRLTGSSGDPVADGNYALTFSLWDDSTAGSQQWSETHASVAVTDGLFSVNLGKNGSLDASIFETEPLFLQIQIGLSEIIEPRTRLTSAPTAVAAKKVAGDIETGEGSMVIKSAGGDSAIIIDAGSAGRGYPSLVLNNMDAEPLGPMIEMTTDPTASSRIKIHAAQPTFSGRVLLNAFQSDSSEISLIREGLVPHDDPTALQLKASSSGASFIMNNPDAGYLDQELVRLSCDADGGKFSLYPPGSFASNPAFTIGLEPTPFRHPYMSFYDPSGSFPNDPAIKMGIEPSPFMEMTEQSLGYGDRPTMRMGFEPSPFHHGYIAMYNPEIGPPPKLLEVGINDSTGEWESRIKMRLAHPPEFPTGKDILTISAAPSTGASIKMATPLPEPPATIMEMKVEEVVGPSASYGSYFNMYSMDPGNDGRETFEVSNTLTDGISFKMFNPQPEPPAVYFEVNADASSGPSLGFFDDIGQVLGLDPSPFNEGFSIKLTDPGDDGELFALTGNHVTNEVDMYLIDPVDKKDLLTMHSDPTSGASLGFFDDIGQVMGFDPSPFNEGFSIRLIDPGDDENLFELTGNHITNEVDMYLIDPVDKRDLLTMHSDPTNGASFRMFNPQPEPPAKLFDLSVNVGIKSSDDIVMELTSGDSLYQTKIAPGRVKVGHPMIDAYPRGELNAGADTVMFYLLGNTGYVEAPPIGMMSSSTEAKVGIGTLTPTEELHVVGDICYTGSIGTCSDVRYKKDIKTLDNALDRVSRLRGVSFNWKKDEFPQHKFSPESQVGLIAQEVKEVLPQVVSEDNNGYYNIDYTKITPILIEAIKELKSENEELKQNNENLVRRIEKLEAQ